jgi:hypothetical protein
VKYHAYGLVFSSDLPLPELAVADTSVVPASLAVSLRSDPVREDGWRWLQPRPAKTEGPWLAVAKREGRHRLLFDGDADFVVAADDAAVVAHAPTPAALEAVRRRLVDQVIPLVMSHLGRFVLHASAVATPHGAVAFIGAAGAGKSTLSASFGLRGVPVIADDAVFVEKEGGAWLAIPAYAGVRVWPDVLPALAAAGTSAGARRSGDVDSADKRRLTSGDGVRFATMPMHIRRVYVLDTGPVRIERLTRRDAVMALLGHTFVLDISDRRRLAGTFSRVAAASEALDVRRLTYPRDLDALPHASDAVLADVGGS